MLTRSLKPKIPMLPLRNVLQGGSRSLAAVAGVAFVATMVLLQLGFLGAVRDTATSLYDRLDFDVALVSPRYEQLYESGTVPLERLRQARGVAGVDDATPFYVMFAMWRCPPSPLDGDKAAEASGRDRPVRRRELLAMGVDLDADPFLGETRGRVAAARDTLRLDGRVLLNDESQADFGRWAWPEFKDWEMNGHSVQVVGGFPIPRGFGADGSVVLSDLNFRKLCAPPGYSGTSLGLLRIKGRGAGPVDETVKALNALLPADTLALSRAQLIAREQNFWVNQTSTGKIFASGVLVAAAVAAVVVYQVLSNDVRSRLREYATLKAMGYTDGFLSRVVITQALVYAVGAFGPAFVLSYTAYRVTELMADVAMRLTPTNLALTFFLTAVVSLLSALLTVGKLRDADPADLF